MDLQLGEGEAEGIQLTRDLVGIDPNASVVVLTALKDHHLAVHAAAAGAVGFLQKDGSSHTVISALKAVHNGYLMISPDILAEIGRQLPLIAAEEVAPTLSARESGVLALMGNGLRPRLIADQLGISIETVRSHTHSLMRKLGTHTQVQTVLEATRLGLIGEEQVHEGS